MDESQRRKRKRLPLVSLTCSIISIFSHFIVVLQMALLAVFLYLCGESGIRFYFKAIENF
jgi:hypothetical protein